MNNKYEPCSICELYICGYDCHNYKCPVAKMKAEIERLTEQNARLNKECDHYIDFASTTRAEAIKEFAEKVKENQRAIFNTIYSKSDYCKMIDKLVRETMEKDNGTK